MDEAVLLHELVLRSAMRVPERAALTHDAVTIDYQTLANEIERFASALVELGVRRGERVAIYLEKRRETVVASFGAPAAGAAFVPINPLLKPDQVAYILRDCNVRVLVTSPERWKTLAPVSNECPDLQHLIVTAPVAAASGPTIHDWREMMNAALRARHRVIDNDLLAILYTSGSTGKPKGVVLSHRNMVMGAKSVAQYLRNHRDDVLLAALPLSFDAGFSQLTTAFHVGARAVLLNYLLPKDVLNAVSRERVTGLTAVPPLWIQLTQLAWPTTITEHLRYIANTGGRMPFETLSRLRAALPKTKPYLMYGLTEAFRATYLPPEEVDRRPDSIGKAIPNAEILVLRDDGSECAVDEPGELVQRGALVGLGYWNDPVKTAERYKPLPTRDANNVTSGVVMQEIAVFSGDTVTRDADGFLYFIGRRDEMIKTSGYRVSPNEIEEALYNTQRVGECAAFGIEHPTLGQAIVVVATPPEHGTLDVDALLADCRARLPIYMLPAHVDVRSGPLPRNQNGKIDRKTLSGEFAAMFTAAAGAAS